MKRPAEAEGGFAALVLPHLDAAYNLARWLMHDAVLAEDVVQDAMVRALRFQGGFRGGNARAWLLRIVRNVAWQSLKDRGALREDTLPDPDHPDGAHIADASPDPEASLAAAQDLAQVSEILASLPAELRECLVLRELEEMSYKEIAHITGVPVGTVMSRLWRGRQALMAHAR